MNPQDNLLTNRTHQLVKYGEPLSPRELEVLELVACGLQAKEVAQRLHLAYYTVHNHLLNGRIKLGARNSAHAVALLYEQKGKILALVTNDKDAYQ